MGVTKHSSPFLRHLSYRFCAGHAPVTHPDAPRVWRAAAKHQQRWPPCDRQPGHAVSFFFGGGGGSSPRISHPHKLQRWAGSVKEALLQHLEQYIPAEGVPDDPSLRERLIEQMRETRTKWVDEYRNDQVLQATAVRSSGMGWEPAAEMVILWKKGGGL